MNRRRFLKSAGGGAAAVSAIGAAAAGVSISGCDSPKAGPVSVIDPDSIPKDKMTYRVNPRTGDKVSLLGFGCMRFPLKSKSKAEEAQYEIDQEAVNEMFDYAIDHGVNYFDTSGRYCRGFSERATGIALSRYPRDKYFLATKMSNQAAKSREESIGVYEKSKKELQTDYFDYYLIHAVGKYEVYKERYLDNGILDFMLKEREAGRIRNLGWSFHGEKEFFDFMMSKDKCGVEWDFVQIQANYFDWDNLTGLSSINARYLYETLERLNVPVIIMEPLLGGRLAAPNYKAQALMKQTNPDLSFASWAFRFVGSLPNVLTVLSGMTYMEHLQDNLLTYSPLKPLTDEERKVLEQVAETMKEFRSINCTNCQYCMPCPYGIDIPAIFMHYNRCLNEGNFPDDPASANYKKARRAFLVGFDRSVPKLRQANHCIGCDLCRPKCPQSIKISTEMQRIDQFVEELKLNRGKAGL